MKPTWESDCGTVKLWLGDCRDILKSWSDSATDVMVTDPPYGVGINYNSHDDNMTPDEWQEWCREWLFECFRVANRVLITGQGRPATISPPAPLGLAFAVVETGGYGQVTSRI